MNDKMRITYLVKEPCENDVLLSWQGAQCGFGKGRIFCKLSGMMDLRCTIRPAPTDVAHYAPYLDILWNAFGEDRMIFGSDWPVSDNSERSYADVLKLAQDYIHPKGEGVTQKVFCDNARAAYKWIERS